MSAGAEWAITVAERGLLRVASLLVPATERSDWLQEWDAELWHVQREACDDWQSSQKAAVIFCLGALPDALEMRRSFRVTRLRATAMHRSAGYCLLVLVLILAASWAIALRSPAVLAELRYAARPELVLIRDARAPSDWAATIPVERYRQWATLQQKYFNGLAYYQIERGTLIAGDQAPTMQVAHASANLFAQLGLRPKIGDATPTSEPRLVLSEEVWNQFFGSDARIVGRHVRLGSRMVRIAAVLPLGAWRLPGKAEAWLLEPDDVIQKGIPGYVVARLNQEGRREMWCDGIPVQSLDPDGNTQNLWAVSLDERTRGPWGVYFFSLLLAILALPALTSVSLSEPVSSIARPVGVRQVLRWGFLAAKLALVLGILAILPLDLAYSGKPGYVPGASETHLALTLGMSIFGFWWAVADQRKRCPVCLRRVTHPARVGMASQTFLAWNGMELICLGGHTLLHVPALPTSWFNCPRWIYLDDSWEFLFVASTG